MYSTVHAPMLLPSHSNTHSNVCSPIFIPPLNQTHSVVCPSQFILPLLVTHRDPTGGQETSNPLEEEIESGMHCSLNFKYDNIFEYLKFRVIYAHLYSSSMGLGAFSTLVGWPQAPSKRRTSRGGQTPLCI